VAGDIGILLFITASLFAVTSLMFVAALRYARRAGTLAQY
jgi:hypothetical protein